MEPFSKKLKRILKRAFPKPDRVRLRDEDGIIGFVISPRFRGLDSSERLAMIWSVLDAQLTPEERRRIVIMIAVTPEEELAHSS